MTESEKREIKRLWESGMPFSKIHRMVALPISQFRKAVAEMREDGEFSSSRPSTAERVCAEFDNGERNAMVIAERLGLSENTVRSYLIWNGRRFGKKTRNLSHCERTIEIAQDLKDGELTQYKIAQKHGVSKQYVNKVKQKVDRGIL